MAESPPTTSTAESLLEDYRGGALSPVEVLEALISRIEVCDPALNAVTTPAFEEALVHARVAERRWRDGSARRLEGVPVLVKDLLDAAGTRATYGSAMYLDHVPVRDAEVVRRIRRAGGIVLAKAATHEFGWGISTESRRFGSTRNPWAPTRSPGGSSGGSAAGLAAGYAPLAVGTDTAGSIRIPAAFCGVTGLKPTFGAVPVAGSHPLVPSLDHLGPMARTADDLALLWSVMADRPITPRPPERTVALTVGVLSRPVGPEPAPAVAAACAAAAQVLAEAGHRVVEVDAGPLEPAFTTLGTTVLAEGIATHRSLGLWPDRVDEYEPGVRARLELAARLDPGEVVRARSDRDAVRTALAEIFARVDVLLSPVSATGPSEIGAAPADYREQVMTGIAPQSLAGLPALALRAGFDDDGLPVGVQLSAAAGRERRLLDLGARFQQATAEIQKPWPVC